MNTEDKSEAFKFIRSKTAWSDLPSRIKANFNNDEKKWQEFVTNFCKSNQVSYRSSSVSFYVLKEQTYYNQMIQNSKSNLLLYPYHLQIKIVRLFNITPFVYYTDMLVDQFTKEKSYDLIPNFTANDCLQLLGIGRNQYIDISNANKSKIFGSNAWGILKKPFKQQLPQSPNVWNSWEPWWIARAGSILVSDIENCSATERNIIDQLIDNNGVECGLLDKGILKSLFSKNLIILEVPVNEDDRFVVLKLESFVMNRIQGDYMESLMYKIIVAIDENTSLSDLSALLDADLAIVKQAISIFCRLGLIYKKNPFFDKEKLHATWLEHVNAKESQNRNSNEKKDTEINPLSQQPETAEVTPFRISVEGDQGDKSSKRIAFIYDSTLTAILMLGNLSQELKTYAMTMFEMGKLTHEMMDDFMEKISQIAVQSEGEAKHYYTAVMNLLKTLKFLKKRTPAIDEWYDEKTLQSQNSIAVDMIHSESLVNLPRVAMLKHFNKKYTILVSMAPISSATSPVSCSSPPFFGPPIAEFNSLWYRLYIYETVKAGPPSLFVPRGTVLIVLPSIFQNFESIYMAQPNQPPTIIPCNQSIHLINDLLRHSCIFLQGFSRDRELDHKLVHIPFPLDSFGNKKIDQLFSKLTTEHNLSKGFGVLTLIKFEKQRSLKRQNTLSEYSYDFDESNSSVYQPPISGLPEGYRNIDQSFYYESTDAITQANAKETILDNKYDWLPFEIVHGIPLFNDTLNDCICEKISNLNLFSHQNTQEYISENRKIILKLMDFIIKYGGKRSETIQKAVTDPKNKRYTYLPTKPVMFYNGSVSNWSIHCEL